MSHAKPNVAQPPFVPTPPVSSGKAADQAVACADRLLALLEELITILWADAPMRIRNALDKARYLSIAEIAAQYNDRCHKFLGLDAQGKHLVEDADAKSYLPVIAKDCRDTGRTWSLLRVTIQDRLMQADRVGSELMLLLGTHGNTAADETQEEGTRDAGAALETARKWIAEVTAAINEMAEIHFHNCPKVMEFYRIRYLHAKGKKAYQKRTNALDPNTKKPLLNADGTKQTVEASIPEDLERLSRSIEQHAVEIKRLNKTGADSLPHIKQAVLELKQHLDKGVIPSEAETVVVVRTASTPPPLEEAPVIDQPAPLAQEDDIMEEGEVRDISKTIPVRSVPLIETGEEYMASECTIVPESKTTMLFKLSAGSTTTETAEIIFKAALLTVPPAKPNTRPRRVPTPKTDTPIRQTQKRKASSKDQAEDKAVEETHIPAVTTMPTPSSVKTLPYFNKGASKKMEARTTPVATKPASSADTSPARTKIPRKK